jgi:hypothetical protein
VPVRPVHDHAVNLPPHLAPRLRALPPPLPARPPRPPLVNWRPVAAAGGAALVLVVAVLAWAVTHPSARARRAAESAEPTPPAEKVVAVQPEIVTPPATVTQAPEAPAPETPSPRSAPQIIQASVPSRHDAPPAEARAEPHAASVCQTFGTSVEFDANPAHAAKQAAESQKLLMVLHVSGNFEESAFT